MDTAEEQEDLEIDAFEDRHKDSENNLPLVSLGLKSKTDDVDIEQPCIQTNNLSKPCEEKIKSNSIDRNINYDLLLDPASLPVSCLIHTPVPLHYASYLRIPCYRAHLCGVVTGLDYTAMYCSPTKRYDSDPDLHEMRVTLRKRKYDEDVSDAFRVFTESILSKLDTIKTDFDDKISQINDSINTVVKQDTMIPLCG
ncbi:unnamed protein product [Parnassius apollo]|uniref:(apollo) hypothetical protein n=1 Tax=Parnassius apollo TaxID=110799 RepID=A0A8S3WFA8_PARAO|nr:unnamed protein product [Parnassius apollo]